MKINQTTEIIFVGANKSHTNPARKMTSIGAKLKEFLCLKN